MEKSNYTWLWVLLVIAVIGVAAWKFGKHKNNVIDNPDDEAKPPKNKKTQSSSNGSYSKGGYYSGNKKRIKLLQKHLNRKHNARLDVDGIVGELTRGAMEDAKYKTA